MIRLPGGAGSPPQNALPPDRNLSPFHNPQILSAIRSIQPAQSTDKPIFWTVDTSIDADHTAGNDALPKLANAATRQAVRVVAHQNVVNRMAAAPRGAEPLVPDKLWPNDEYFLPQKDLSFNGEAVVIYHEPHAHTDGDSIIFFRASDVISAGDIFTPGAYPFIDLERGGSVEGEIAALHHLLALTVPAHTQDGGTYVIPGHGRICDEADVVEYRDMPRHRS